MKYLLEVLHDWTNLKKELNLAIVNGGDYLGAFRRFREVQEELEKVVDKFFKEHEEMMKENGNLR